MNTKILPEWYQPKVKIRLGDELYEILKITMKYVDEAWKVEIDHVQIEQELQDITDKIQELAMKIENGEYRKEEEI